MDEDLINKHFNFTNLETLRTGRNDYFRVQYLHNSTFGKLKILSLDSDTIEYELMPFYVLSILRSASSTLKEVSFFSIRGEYKPEFIEEDIIFLPALTELKIPWCWAPMVQDLFLHLKCPNLQDLSLQYHSHPAQPYHPFDFIKSSPKLRAISFNLGHNKHECRLEKGPKLKGEGTEEGSFPDSKIIRLVNTGLGLIQYLSQFKLPQLRKLEVDRFEKKDLEQVLEINHSLKKNAPKLEERRLLKVNEAMWTRER